MKPRRKEKFEVSYEPSFFDLINIYFPPEYAKKYSNPETLLKVVAAPILKNPQGSHDYIEKCQVHEAMFKLKQKDPYITPSEAIKHPSIKKFAGKRLSEETLREWIRPILRNKPGRPAKRPTK